jgi:MFS family permease
VSSYLRVLHHRDFTYLFLGQSASAVGDQAVIVALVLYITGRTGSATDIGVVLAAQTLPMVALMLFGGVWADRGGARGLSEMTANLATVAGPALGTALVLGIGEAFAFDAATFILSALLLARVRPPERTGAPLVARPAVLRELRAGWREVRSRPWVWERCWGR